MSAAIRSAHEAASTLASHPQPSEDVVMVSADPILIVNSQDQPAIESAEIRTEIAMSGLTVSGSSAPGSLVKYAIMASLPSERMDMCHLSEDVKLFASNFKTSGDTFDFKQFMDSQAQRHWLILNDAEFKLFSQHHVLQVPRVKEPSGGHILNWKIHESLQDAIYHMIYLTVAHCVRHGSPAASVRPVNSLHDCIRCHASRSSSALRGRGSLRDQVTQPQESCTWSSQVVILHGSTSALQSFHTVVGQFRRPITVHVISCSLL